MKKLNNTAILFIYFFSFFIYLIDIVAIICSILEVGKQSLDKGEHDGSRRDCYLAQRLILRSGLHISNFSREVVQILICWTIFLFLFDIKFIS